MSSKSVIGTAASFTGQASSAGALEIHGIFNADIKLQKLTIEQGGHCHGDLDIQLGVFAGEYRGNVKAESIWLLSSAHIYGRIEYGALQMDRGAALNCHILHNWKAPADTGDAPPIDKGVTEMSLDLGKTPQAKPPKNTPPAQENLRHE